LASPPSQHLSHGSETLDDEEEEEGGDEVDEDSKEDFEEIPQLGDAEESLSKSKEQVPLLSHPRKRRIRSDEAEEEDCEEEEKEEEDHEAHMCADHGYESIIDDVELLQCNAPGCDLTVCIIIPSS